MKSIPTFALAMLIATLILAVLPTDAEAKIYEDTLRLHILANSDSEEDQEIKLLLRDEILSEFGSELSDFESLEQARIYTEELLPEIEEYSEEFLRSLGVDMPVCATLSVEWYDTREYEDFSLPSGYYNSLRIIIGEGDGKNWWCVMYPPLCMDIATESAPADDATLNYTTEELMLIGGGRYNVKFKILEVISSAFRKK